MLHELPNAIQALHLKILWLPPSFSWKLQLCTPALTATVLCVHVELEILKHGNTKSLLGASQPSKHPALGQYREAVHPGTSLQFALSQPLSGACRLIISAKDRQFYCGSRSTSPSASTSCRGSTQSPESQDFVTGSQTCPAAEYQSAVLVVNSWL